MTAQEFSNEFDLLYNNISSNQAPGLDEYEKSVFLTKAQDEIIKNYFTNVQGGNKYQQGVEDSEKRYADFSTLLTVATIQSETGVTPFDERGKIFRLPDGTYGTQKVMIVITETFQTGSEISITSYQVIPLKFDEYIRLMSKPSSDPLKRQVWKLMGNNETGNGSIEIVPHWKDKNNTINKLILKYIRKPYPIILEDLTPQGLTIEGMYKTPETPIYEDKTYNSSVTIVFPDMRILDNRVWHCVDTILPSTPDYIGLINVDPVKRTIELDYVPDEGGTISVELYTNALTNAEFIKLKSLIGCNQIDETGRHLNYAHIVPTISSYSQGPCCELAEELHPEILQRAVELAKIFYTGDNQQVLTAGTRSE